MRAECRARDWPLTLTVRLVTVRLSSGELEVLATSLWDADAYPTAAFGPVYWQRWGHETYYGRLKGRLDLEHCSGQTVEAVEQDFHATVLLSNVESLVVGVAQAELAVRTAGRQQPAQVNRAVSLHAIKYRLIQLLTSRVPAAQVLAELTAWFQANPVSVRPGRTVRRRKFSPRALLPLPAADEKNRVLNMKSLFQRQWGRGEGEPSLPNHDEKMRLDEPLRKAREGRGTVGRPAIS